MSAKTLTSAVTVLLLTGCGLFDPDYGAITVAGTAYVDGVPFYDAARTRGGYPEYLGNLKVSVAFSGPPGLTDRGAAELFDSPSSSFAFVAKIPSADCEYVSVQAYTSKTLIAEPWGPFPGFPSDSSAGYWLPCTRDTIFVGLDFQLVPDTVACAYCGALARTNTVPVHRMREGPARH